MTVTVIERVSAETASSSSIPVTLTTTPAVGDVLVAVLTSVGSNARTLAGVSGAGASWAAGQQVTRFGLWVGTTPSAAGTITFTQSVGGAAQATIYLVRGLTSAATAGAGLVHDTGVIAGPSLPAGAGQFVIAGTVTTTDRGITFPSDQTPSTGWSAQAINLVGAGNGNVGEAWRSAAGASTAHFATVTSAGATISASATFVVGASDSNAPIDATLAATRPRRTGSFAVASLVDMTLGGLRARRSGDFATAAIITGLLELTLAGVRARRAAQFDAASDPFTVPAEAAGITLAGAVQRKAATFVATPVVPVTPAPIVAASGHAVVVAQAFGPVTMQGTQPVYSIEQAAVTRARQRIIADGNLDVTYFRGGILPDVTYTLVSPLLYGPGELEVPQVSACFERLGTGDLSWLRPGVTVEVQRVLDDVVVGTDYKGVIVALDTNGRGLRVELGGEAAGRAALRNRQVPIFPRVNDIGHQIDDAVRDLGLPTLPHLGPVTGIETMTTGGTGHLEHIQDLVSRAFTKAGRQWTIMPDANGIYRTKRKDITTVHATAFLDDARTVANLRRDVAEEPSRIFGTGVTPQGQRVRNGVYPGLVQGKAPAFPGPMRDGDTGEAVQVLINRLWAVGYLGLRDAAGGYDDDVHDAVFDLQTDAGFFDNGFSTTEPGWVDEKTWRALYDLDVTGASLEGAHVEPMAQRRKVRKWNRSGSGAITSLNAVYDPEALVVDRNIDYGSGLKRRQMFNRSKAELHDSDAPNWVGDIAFHTGALIRGQKAIGATLTEADVMDARELQPGMNLWLPQFDGGTLVHVSACAIDGEGVVTATVDTRFRDSMEVWEVIARNKESRRDPARNRERQHRSSTIIKDSIGEWDEIGGVLGNDVDLDAGWNVVKVVGAAEGTIAKIRLLVQTINASGGSIGITPHEFACAVFGREIGPGTLANLVPQPLTVEGAKAWEKRRDALDDHWLLYAAGTHDEPGGYSPGRKHFKSVTTEEPNPDYDPATDPDSEKVVSVTTQESWGVLTGKHVDDASFAYRSDERTWLYVAVWVAKPTTLHAGRIMWPQLEAGV